MSEKRRPEFIFYAERQGIYRSTRKRLMKVEWFPAIQWQNQAAAPMFGKGKSTGKSWHETRGDVYRIRVNGKWYKPKNRKQTFTLSELFAIYRATIKQARIEGRRADRKLLGSNGATDSSKRDDQNAS